MTNILKLRVLLPLLIGLLSLVATTTSYFASKQAVHSATKQSVIGHLQSNLTRAQGVLETIVNTQQISAINTIIASYGAQPDMLLTVVTNQKGKIIASTAHQYLFKQWSEPQIGIEPSIINKILNERTISIEIAEQEQFINGYVSICPRKKNSIYRSQDCSFLLQRVDLNYHLDRATHLLKQQAIYTSLSIVILAFVIGFILNEIFAKRSQRLALTVEAFSKGQRQVRSGIKGQDEISLIAQAVDLMLDQIERNQSELTAEKNRLNTLFDTVDDPILTIDDQAMITSCNYAARAVFNYPEEQLLKRNIYSLIPDLYPLERTVVKKNTNKNLQSTKTEYNAIRRDGSNFPAEFSIGDMEVDGHIEQITVVRDISDYKAVEGELLEHRDNLQDLVAIATKEITAIVQTAGNGVITLDKEGLVQIFNPAAEQLFGWERLDIRDQHITVLMPDVENQNEDEDDEDLQNQTDESQFISHFLRNHEPNVVGVGKEVIAQRKDGTTFPAHINVGHRDMGNGKDMYVVFIADISEQKTTEQELITAKDRAELAAQTKANFLANMSHEIRTPMNAIIGFSEILVQDELIPDHSKQFVHTILDSGKNLLQIIDDILDFTKIEAGKIVLESLSFNLTNSMKNAMKMFQISAEKKNISIKLEIDETIPDIVTGDPTRLRQVLTNLVGNALKFTHEGSITVKIAKVDNKTDDKNQIADMIQFSVTDTGIGMSVKQLKKVFEAFSQADSSTNRRFGGTGLGTTISKEIVELMKGKMWVDSVQGQGSTFYFTAHLPHAPNYDLESTEAPGVEFETQYQALRILLAESIASNAQLVTLKLLKQGHDVTWVTNGQQAVNKATSEKFDLILMDIPMPNLDGAAAARQIRDFEQYKKTRHPVPIIALAIRKYSRNKQQYLDCGMNEVVNKPIDFNELFATIDKLMSPRYDKPTDPKTSLLDDENTAKFLSDSNQPATLEVNDKDKKQIQEILIQLHTALDMLNPDACAPFTKQLASLVSDKLVNTIDGTINEFDFDEAKQAVESLAAKLEIEIEIIKETP